MAAIKLAAKLELTGSNSFRIGPVEFDQRTRTVTIPARTAVRTQVVEYALVTERGKAYESLFTTTASPTDLHLAFLLLGVVPTSVGGEFNHAAQVSSTNSLAIEVTWETNRLQKSLHLGDLISLSPPGPFLSSNSMKLETWLYNGSVFDASGFAAQREGSIISLIRDPAALVNNPAPDRDNDQIHWPRQYLLPPENWPLRIVMKLPVPPAPPAEPLPPWVSPITPLRTNPP
jgi:hypothetical protein